MENLIKRSLVVEGVNYQFVADIEAEEVSVTTESDEEFQIIAMGDEINQEDVDIEINVIKALFERFGTQGLLGGINYCDYGCLESFAWDEDLVNTNHVSAVKAYLKVQAIELARELKFGM